MFDDVPTKTNELAKELTELKEAITKLVEVVKPLAEEAELRAAERKMAAARFENEMAIRAAIYEARAQLPQRCDCSPTRERFLGGIFNSWIGRE